MSKRRKAGTRRRQGIWDHEAKIDAVIRAVESLDASVELMDLDERDRRELNMLIKRVSSTIGKLIEWS